MRARIAVGLGLVLASILGSGCQSRPDKIVDDPAGRKIFAGVPVPEGYRPDDVQLSSPHMSRNLVYHCHLEQPVSVESLARFYQEELPKNGWTSVRWVVEYDRITARKPGWSLRIDLTPKGSNAPDVVLTKMEPGDLRQLVVLVDAENEH
jgi:hypothetical protein